MNSFSQHVDTGNKFFSLLLFVALLLSDILIFFVPKLGILGIWVWYTSFFVICVYTLFQFLRLFKAKAIWVIAMIIAVCTFIGVHINDLTHVSGETTQEIACMLNQFSTSEDKGYNQTCLFEYPSRQFLVPAVPSVLFGRSVFSLHVGSSIYIVIGFALMIMGMYQYLKTTHVRYPGIVAAGVSTLLFHVHYVHHFLFLFEQSIFPFSFALMSVGFFFLYLAAPQRFPKGIAGILLYFIIYSYTSSIALYFFAFVVIVFLLSRESVSRKNKLIWILLFCGTLISFGLSLHFRGDIRLTNSHPNIIQLQSDSVEMINELVMPKDFPYVSYPVAGIFILIFLLSLSMVFSCWTLIPGIWIAGVFLSSVIFVGYSYYSVPFRMHRAIVSVPIIVALAGYYLSRLKWQGNALFGILFMLVSSILGYQYFQNVYALNDTNKKSFIIHWLSMTFQTAEQKTVYFFDADGGYISLADELTYFIPTYKSINLSHGTVNKEDEPYCALKNPGIYMLFNNNDCLNDLQKKYDQNSSVKSYVLDIPKEERKLIVYEQKGEDQE